MHDYMKNLECLYDSRKSFYGKAKVLEVYYNGLRGDGIDRQLDLYSYGTLVATVVYNYNQNFTGYKYYGRFSNTTTRHQKGFFKQNGLTDEQMKELFKNKTIIVYNKGDELNDKSI